MPSKDIRPDLGGGGTVGVSWAEFDSSFGTNRTL